MHHAFVIEADREEGIKTACAWIQENLGMEVQGNPDMVTLRFGLLSVEDARRVCESASQAPFRGDHKAIVIATARAYHEAQNALLKLFEEPPPNTYLFLILPSLGGLLPTLRSRVHILGKHHAHTNQIPEIATEFLKGTKEKRSALIKKLTTGKDEDDRRAKRDEVISLLNGIEVALLGEGIEKHAATLQEIGVLRGYLYDRSAPVKMILEHVSLVLPKKLL